MKHEPTPAKVDLPAGQLTLYVITEYEYNKLKNRSLYLQALEDAGVDNWGGIDYANQQFYGEDEDE